LLISRRLADADDDVRSAAAGCLVPVTRSIVEHLLGDLPKLLAVLWGCFESMRDDLGSSISAVMDLLGALVSFPQVMDIFADEARSYVILLGYLKRILTLYRQSLNQLAPLLFPFFRHTISNVRLAVVRTVRQFILVQNLPVDWVEISFLRILFQNILLEEKDDVRSLCLETWRLALKRITPNVPSIHTLIPVMVFRDWIETCTTPIGEPIDITRLFALEHQESSADLYNVDKNMISQDLSLVSLETVWRARIASAQSLAILANMLAIEVSSACNPPDRH
jgi:TATA-binding protein-associated factor